MKKTYDVVALGELLIDFAPAGLSPAGSPLFECNPGGAPANLLTAVARQGGKAAFLGKVGEDAFGRLLGDTLAEAGVSTEGLLFDPHVRTTLAFVSLDSRGDRTFSFFRNPGADIMLRPEEVREDLIRGAGIFHFGSLSLTDEPARGATLHALDVAADSGAVISYDPNLRPPLWPSLEEAKAQIASCLPRADILKVSEEEFQFLTGTPDYEAHGPAFAAAHGISCLFVTLGPRGAYYCCNGLWGALPAYDVTVVDTTGSGDAFMGAALARLSALGKPLAGLDRKDLEDIVSFANASGSMTARTKGGIPAIPTAGQVRAFLAGSPGFAESAE